ncbi:polysaccharide deacetylase family protein [Candidatus Hydrogenedentota bacterium]
MICLTGDLHHMSLKTGNQEHCDITEIQVAQRYLKMLEEAKIKVTFFITGKAFAEEWDDLKPICEHPLVEVAGHTYYCFKPELWHRAWNKLAGSYNGPAWYQRWDIAKTARIISDRCGRDITCWRNHMYMHGPHTEESLKVCGLKICSDGVQKESTGPERHPSGILNFPLNVMPDHEHLYHAERNPEWVKRWVKRYDWSDDYGSESYYVEEWTERVLDELRQHEEAGIISNMLIHPITLYLCDRLKSFERILELVAGAGTVHMRGIFESAERCSRPGGQ